MLGPPRLEQEEKPVEFDTRKAMALLAYLAVTGQSHSRDMLATLFWPEYDQGQARANLRRTLSALTKAIGKTWLEVDRETLSLAQSENFWLDTVVFHRLLADSRGHKHPPGEICPDCLARLEQALALYRGDFMTGFSLRDSPGFEEWQFFEAEQLRQEVIKVLEQLVQGHLTQKDSERAITYARRWVALEPLDEVAHSRLIQAYAWSGQRSAALRQYQELVRLLDEELGIPPQPETKELYHAIQENSLPLAPLPHSVSEGGKPGESKPMTATPGSPLYTPPMLPASTPQSQLPAQTTPFIGRETELSELVRLLADPGCRLLTLAGPGGVGKTRLAIEVAAQSPIFPDGMYFISLVHVTEAAFVATAIAGGLSFNLYGSSEPKVQLLNYLREKKLLLVLDSLEHLQEAANFLAEILQAAPSVKLLVTSRERLNLWGEWVYEVQGLPLPPAHQQEQLENYGAVALFVQSGRRVHSGFQLTATDRPFVLRICQLVGGLPLGIELAAAWVRLLSCAEIAQEIERNFDFLTTARRDLPERHHSLRMAFDHSWNLLSAEERRVLSRLSIFRGGFRREAAEQVAGATLPVLSSLVDKFLVHRLESGRYELHEIVCQYTIAQLQENSEQYTLTGQQHSHYYTQLLQESETRLKSPQQKETLALLSAEMGNIHLAWEWAVTHDQTDDLQHSLSTLFCFFELRCGYREAFTFFRAALDHLQLDPTLQPPATHEMITGPRASRLSCLGQLKVLCGFFLFRQGLAEEPRQHQARLLLQEGISLLRSLDERLALGDAYLCLGIVTYMGGNYTEGRQLVEQSRELSRALGNYWTQGLALSHLALIAYNTGHYLEAQRLFQEALSLSRLLEEPRSLAFVLSSYSLVAMQLGAYDQAQKLLTESLEISSANHDRWGIAAALNRLGQLALRREPPELNEARYLLRESAALFKELGAYWVLVWVLDSLGQVAYALADEAEARWAFLEALNVGRTIPIWPAALAALVGLATLLHRAGDTMQALELVTQVLTHPATDQQVKDRAEKLRIELEAQLSPEQIRQARTSSHPLDAIVESIHRKSRP